MDRSCEITYMSEYCRFAPDRERGGSGIRKVEIFTTSYIEHKTLQLRLANHYGLKKIINSPPEGVVLSGRRTTPNASISWKKVTPVTKLPERASPMRKVETRVRSCKSFFSMSK